MESSLVLLPKNTQEIKIGLLWSEIKSKYDEIINKAAKDIEIKGFRKGKAPKKLVEEKIDKNKVFQEVIKEIVPEIYRQTLQKYNLQPITTPKIELIRAEEHKDWQIKITIAQKPPVNLGNYQQMVREVKKESAKIWTPDSAGKQTKKDEPTTQSQKINKILTKLLETIKIEIADLIVENELNRRLAQTLDEVKKLGLTLDQYLASTNKNVDQLKQQLKIQVVKDLQLQLILEEIADAEKIIVTDTEIEKMIAQAPEAEKEKTKQQKYFLASVIRRQKTLDYLLNL